MELQLLMWLTLLMGLHGGVSHMPGVQPRVHWQTTEKSFQIQQANRNRALQFLSPTQAKYQPVSPESNNHLAAEDHGSRHPSPANVWGYEAQDRGERRWQDEGRRRDSGETLVSNSLEHSRMERELSSTERSVPTMKTLPNYYASKVMNVENGTISLTDIQSIDIHTRSGGRDNRVWQDHATRRPSQTTKTEDRIFFPTAPSTVPAPSLPRAIPLHLVNRLNRVHNISELWTFVSDAPSPDDLTNRFGDDIDRKSVVNPKPAHCEPEMQTVTLKNADDDPSMFFFPSCTRLERCGGCCSHDLLSCQAVEKKPVHFRVIVTQYGGGNQFSYKGKEVVTLEQHTKCKCDCIVKENDCNQFQEYRKDECRCICTNFDDQEKCYAENETKLWDVRNCLCRCREEKECSTGLYYDENTCSCVVISPARRNSLELRSRRGQIGRHGYTIITDGPKYLTGHLNETQDMDKHEVKTRQHRAGIV